MSGFQVMEKRCSECLFSINAIVRKGRREEILKHCARNDRYFVCHKSSIAGGNACCRGYYDRDPHATNLMRIAACLGVVEFVPEPKEEKQA